MQPHDIDDLFRDQLRHYAPTPPPRLWDQLEAELQPPARKRPVMWLYAMAASLALLLVAGGAWLWQNGSLRSGTDASLATTRKTPLAQANRTIAGITQKTKAQTTLPTPTASSPSLPQPTEVLTASAPTPAASQATVTKPRRPALATPQPAQLVATGTPARRSAPLTSPTPNHSFVATPVPAPVQPEHEASQPDKAGIAAATSAPAAPAGTIEVEVRRAPTAAVIALAEAPAAEPRRIHLKGLLRQARKALRGEKVNLAEAGIPENFTVHARVGSHSVTKVIEL